MKIMGNKYTISRKDNSKVLIGFLCLVFSLTCLLINIFSINSETYAKVVPPSLSIKYDNLNILQMSEISSILEELDSKYVVKQKLLVFVQDIKEYCSNCLAYNSNDGEEIVIGYNSNKEIMKYVICHELLHSYFFLDDQYEENIVDEIARTYVCYKDKHGIVDTRWKTY